MCSSGCRCGVRLVGGRHLSRLGPIHTELYKSRVKVICIQTTRRRERFRTVIYSTTWLSDHYMQSIAMHNVIMVAFSLPSSAWRKTLMAIVRALLKRPVIATFASSINLVIRRRGFALPKLRMSRQRPEHSNDADRHPVYTFCTLPHGFASHSEARN